MTERKTEFRQSEDSGHRSQCGIHYPVSAGHRSECGIHSLVSADHGSQCGIH